MPDEIQLRVAHRERAQVVQKDLVLQLADAFFQFSRQTLA